MATLAQTLGLTDVQQEIVSNVRRFVDKEVIPVASQLEKTDTYPQDIVDKMAEMGLFGLMIPEEYGGIGESLLTGVRYRPGGARIWLGEHPYARELAALGLPKRPFMSGSADNVDMTFADAQEIA